MKKYYDKVLFILALVVLGLGAGIFFQKGGLPAKSASLSAPKLTGDAFATIPAPKFGNDTYNWESPPDQREDEAGWIYYVFTPPKIYWVPGTGWDAQPPTKVVPVPFGLLFVSAKKELYRIQCLGTIGVGDKTDVISFSDEESGEEFHLKVGQENDVSKLHQIKVTDLTFDKVDLGHGVTFRAATATVLDLKTNETVQLTAGVEYAPTNTQLYVLRTDPPFPPQDWKISSQVWKANKVSGQEDTLKFDGSLQGYKDQIIFRVLALDFDKPSVTVEKQFTTKTGRKFAPSRELLLNQASANVDAAAVK